MVRLHMEARKRCYNHPHRETELACDRCKTSLCVECLVKHGDQKLCAQCVAELEAAEAAKLTLRERVAQSLRSFGTGILVFGVLAGVLGGIFFAFRGYFDRPISPEELARFRYAMTGTFETEEGINVSSTVLGAKVARATSEAEGYPAKQVINEYSGPSVVAWRSADASVPQEIVVEFQDSSTVQKVNLVNGQAEPPETYVKDFEILVSTTGPTEGYQSVGRFRLEPTTELQRFEFDPVPARWIMLRVLSNRGSTEYTSLDEFNSYVVPARPTTGPRATQSPAARPSPTTRSPSPAGR